MLIYSRLVISCASTFRHRLQHTHDTRRPSTHEYIVPGTASCPFQRHQAARA